MTANIFIFFLKSLVLLIIDSIFASDLNDLVAQLVEHLPFKERVLGSRPSQVTKNQSSIRLYGGFF